MQVETLTQTVIGADYLRNKKPYPVDSLLDYLYGLMKMKSGNASNAAWEKRFVNEIDAVKYILHKQSL